MLVHSSYGSFWSRTDVCILGVKGKKESLYSNQQDDFAGCDPSLSKVTTSFSTVPDRYVGKRGEEICSLCGGNSMTKSSKKWVVSVFNCKCSNYVNGSGRRRTHVALSTICWGGLVLKTEISAAVELNNNKFCHSWLFKNRESQSELSSLFAWCVHVVSSQAVGRWRVEFLALASDQQTFCCQQGGGGRGQGADGQVTSFFSSCLAEWGSDRQHGKMSETAL